MLGLPRLVKSPSANARDMGLILGSGRSSGGGNDNPLQYSCLENSMDREAWQATVNGVAEPDRTELIHKCMRACTHPPNIC